ncbi:GNAT family N-acetyltransferase [Marivita sp. S6314]|uniref:GNAT family N-acetyltransferase n=1 Tax=Marivita sp. S6314 TaxID=2926406 RepID=UPI001FF4141B|nr:GNAT family N-acetyltransferase [Marivita sp. S6314]MCK0148791.1 GNAT family N-acetyltransferase [Marivita sp. S6314]
MLPCPLQQSDAFARTLTALGTQVSWLTTTPDTRCLVQTRHIRWIGPVHLISRGPVARPGFDTAAALDRFDMPGPLVVNADQPADHLPGFLRLAKSKRVALLPLGTPAKMRSALHGKWRNALRRAERAGVTTDIHTFDPQQHMWIITADLEQQAQRGYRGWPTQFLSTFADQNPGAAQVVTARLEGQPIAAMILLCHAPWATYHIGTTTTAGRATSAHALTLWRAMTWLSAQGYNTLDLGTLNGPPGLTRFKLRSGAQPQALGGTWLRLPGPMRTLSRYWPSIQSPSGQNA